MALDATHKYVPTTAARAIVSVVLLPGVLLFGWTGIRILRQGEWAGLIFVSVAALLVIWVVFLTTSRVQLSNRALVRTWIFGSSTIPMEGIAKLQWSGGRGQLNLVVRTKEEWLMLSSLSFQKPELREMATAILAARDLEGRPLWPPHAGYIDVEEMARRYLVTRTD